MGVDKMLYFVPIKLLLLGVFAVCGLPGAVRLGGDQSKILYQIRAYSGTAHHHLPAQSHGRDLLWLDRCILRRAGPDGARAAGLEADPVGILVDGGKPNAGKESQVEWPRAGEAGHPEIDVIKEPFHEGRLKSGERVGKGARHAVLPIAAYCVFAPGTVICRP